MIDEKDRSFRLVNSGKYPLSNHEKNELAEDFGIDVDGKYALISISKQEFAKIIANRKKLKLNKSIKSDGNDLDVILFCDENGKTTFF